MAVDKSHRRVRQMFGEIAPKYDLLNHLLSMNVDRYWRWRTVRLAAPAGSAPILDVCTGTGDLAFAYQKKTRGSVAVVGTDFCPEMLVVGESKRRRYAGNGGPLSFVAADTQQLPFEDDLFQLVTVAFGLRNVADTDQGLSEMVRVCHPGGRVAILEFSMPRWEPFRTLYGWYFRNILPRIGQWLARNRQQAYNYLPESVGEFPSREALGERMRSAGLCDIRLHSFTMGIAVLHIGTKPDSDR
jgi:demethylmenaquinone methyltransferase/2-methoxy-6-polyprenyl-1,4-benzoquinol methylase